MLTSCSFDLRMFLLQWWERVLEEREALLHGQHRLTVETIDGGHHVHSDKPQHCADIVLPWLQAQNLPAGPQLVNVVPETQLQRSKPMDDEAIMVPADLWTLDPKPIDVPPATEQEFAVCGGSLMLAAKVWAPLGTSNDRRPKPAKRVLAWPGYVRNRLLVFARQTGKLRDFDVVVGWITRAPSTI